LIKMELLFLVNKIFLKFDHFPPMLLQKSARLLSTLLKISTSY